MSVDEGSRDTGSPPSATVDAWKEFTRGVDDGTWDWMLTHGSRGYGVIPWVSDLVCTCCWGRVSNATSGNPWLTPAFVTWESIIDANGKVPGYIIDKFVESDDDNPLIFPTVAITSMLFMDSNDMHGITRHRNLYIDPDDYFEFSENIWKDDPIQALAHVWTVTPIDEQYYRAWKNDMRTTYHAHSCLSFANSVECNSEHQVTTIQDTDGVWEEIQCEGGVLNPVTGRWESNCICGKSEAETELAELEGYDFAEDIYNHRNIWQSTWNYARNRLDAGWEKAYSLAVVDNTYEGESCYLSLVRQRSPQLVSSGPALFHRNLELDC